MGFLFSVVFSLNLVLASLNLIPLPPLDGSGAVNVLLGDRLGASYQAFLFRQGQILALVGMVAAWRLFDVIYHPIFLFAANLLHWGLHYG
jgi:Zn-dependent protease